MHWHACTAVPATQNKEQRSDCYSHRGSVTSFSDHNATNPLYLYIANSCCCINNKLIRNKKYINNENVIYWTFNTMIKLPSHGVGVWPHLCSVSRRQRRQTEKVGKAGVYTVTSLKMRLRTRWCRTNAHTRRHLDCTLWRYVQKEALCPCMQT